MLDGFIDSYHFRFDKGTMGLTGVGGLIVLHYGKTVLIIIIR